MRAFALLFCAVFTSTVVTIVPVLPSPAAAANLIADGGFEANPVTIPGGYVHHAGGASFDGGKWFVTGVDVLQLDRAYNYGTPSMTFASHGGRNSLDLTGTGNSSPLDGVYQDVATVAGQLYRLSFWTGRATGIGTSANDYQDDATARVVVGGGAASSFTNADSLTGGLAWREFTQIFTATAPLTRIAFVNGVGNSYLGLDDVSLVPVSAVPEPASWAMLIGGLFAIGGVGARLRRIKPSRTAR